MSNLINSMSNSNVVPLANWGKNSFSNMEAKKIEAHTPNDYVCYNLPRSMFRAAASLFSDIRHTDQKAKFDEITLQVFLQMISMSSNLEDPPEVFPYVKAWLEWVPHETVETRAVAYRIHAVSLSEHVKFGNQLEIMLKDSAALHNDSMNRKMNSRKVDPLSGLHPYQKWMKVSGLEMYARTICDRYAGTQEYTEKLDDILNPKFKLGTVKPGNEDNPEQVNPVSPSLVFNIDRAIKNTHPTGNKLFRTRNSYVPGQKGERVTKLQFPSHTHVIKLTPGQLHPKVFLSKYLPEHQFWMDNQLNSKGSQPIVDAADQIADQIDDQIADQIDDADDKFTDEVLTEYDIRTAADMERERIQGLSDRSAFASLSLQAKIKYYND
jgi:hypothetical protein